MLRRTHRLGAVLGAITLAAVGLAGCGSDDTPTTPEPAGDDQTTASEGDAPAAGSAEGTITLGFIPSWTDGLSTAYLLENQLTKLGYEVKLETLTEPGILYAGLAGGDYDMYPSAWPEVTHESYMTEFGDQIEDLGAYYDNAKLTVAVPEYSKLTSIEDLPDHADELDGRIVGIEPGAGLTKAVQDSVIPEYGLAGTFELVTSSTPAMLAELDAATQANEEIVVTLWRPFWANSAFSMKDLEDPKGALGAAEALHFLGTEGFAEKFPEAAEYIAGIKLDDEQYGSLEDMVVNEYGEGREAEAVEAWLEANPDAYDTIIK
ncbi:MAG TPA: glycine betaine ABC transporter substrate-binding protein [Intrasporangiaceae bacterium]|nr:glycine betaine ABC transporter substrate-binding protein [Intrasporangiaceae bacterium]